MRTLDQGQMSIEKKI
jgi:hypothetical protein